MSHQRRIFADLPEKLSLGDTASPSDTSAAEILLPADTSRHLTRVLRLQSGAGLIVVSKSSAKEYEGVITEEGEQVKVKLLCERQQTPPSHRVGTLIFALTKGDRNDFVCEKACELGVERILFWQAQRSVVRINAESEKQKKLSRWSKIAESAAKQSCRQSIPQVQLATNIDELFSLLQKTSSQEDRFLCCSLSQGALEIRQIEAPKSKVHLLIGPEGDLTQEEESELCKRGFERISLGSFVLRSETAALAAISMAQGIWGDIE